MGKAFSTGNALLTPSGTPIQRPGTRSLRSTLTNLPLITKPVDRCVGKAWEGVAWDGGIQGAHAGGHLSGGICGRVLGRGGTCGGIQEGTC